MPVRTLNDLKGKDKEEDRNRPGRGEQTYAGGSSSGLNVQNPDRAPDWRQRIIDTAREHGEGGDSDSDEGDDARGAGHRAQPRVFEGAGRRLGLTPSDPAVQAGTTAPPTTGAAAGGAPAGRRRVTMVIHLWEEGFSELHIDLRPHNSKYKVEPKVFKAFGGSGKALTNDEGGASAAAGAAAGAAPRGGAGVAPVGSAPKFSIDESKETTALQIRLADGTRLQARFNLDHTVGDIRAFINNARPGHREFDIITPMPRQVFSDDSQTIAQAGLKGAAIVQHLK